MSARLWWIACLLAATFLLGPATPPAVAQVPFASATLYEVREGVNCNPGPSTDPTCADGAPGFGVRIADATLLGGVGGVPGGISGSINGGITMDASSILSQVDWTGPVHGKLTVTDGTRITFSGQLNLSLAFLGQPGLPIAPVSGNWQVTRGPVRAGGTFAGVFLIPFSCGEASPTGACYLLNGQVVPVEFNELATLPDGTRVPLVKLLFTLTAR